MLKYAAFPKTTANKQTNTFIVIFTVTNIVQTQLT